MSFTASLSTTSGWCQRQVFRLLSLVFSVFLCHSSPSLPLTFSFSSSRTTSPFWKIPRTSSACPPITTPQWNAVSAITHLDSHRLSLKAELTLATSKSHQSYSTSPSVLCLATFLTPFSSLLRRTHFVPVAPVKSQISLTDPRPRRYATHALLYELHSVVLYTHCKTCSPSLLWF